MAFIEVFVEGSAQPPRKYRLLQSGDTILDAIIRAEGTGSLQDPQGFEVTRADKKMIAGRYTFKPGPTVSPGANQAAAARSSGRGQAGVKRKREKDSLQETITMVGAYKIIGKLFRRQMKMQQLSVTSTVEVGKDILRQAKNITVRRTPSSTTTHTALPPSLCKQKFTSAWAKAANEGALQPLAVQAIRAICSASGDGSTKQSSSSSSSSSSHYVLDTHVQDYFKCPPAKIDIALSDSPMALWATLLAPIELKHTLSCVTSYKDAIGQIWDRWNKAQDAQPKREHMTACVMGRDSVQIWTFDKDGPKACTALLPLAWEATNAGYQALVSFLHTPATRLGYVKPQTPKDFAVENSDDMWLRNFKLIAGWATARPVFEAHYAPKKKKRSLPLLVVRVVVKTSSKADIEREVAILVQLKGKRGFPDIVAHGELPFGALAKIDASVTHFYAITPFGEHLGSDHDEATVLMAICDVARAIMFLAQIYILHRDVSPGNIVLAKKDDQKQGILIDYNVAARMDDATSMGVVTGKRMYRALRLYTEAGSLSAPSEEEEESEEEESKEEEEESEEEEEGDDDDDKEEESEEGDDDDEEDEEAEENGAHVAAHSVATEVESLFYTMLHIASDGRALTWRRAPTESIERAMKFEAMFNIDKWARALRHCKEGLQPALERLHDAIFKDSHREYLSHEVTVAQCLAALQGGDGA